MIKINYFAVLSAVLLSACHYTPGPDKQGGGVVQGALTGAGSGAVTGAQFSSTTGPGMAIGAGVGAVAGAFQGAMADAVEEEQYQLSMQIRKQRELAKAHSVLAEHYQRRLDLHPTRDIYPADYFFYGDQAKLNGSAKALVDEIARLNRERLPWSRLVITTYTRGNLKDGVPEKGDYSYYLAEKRSKAIANRLIHSGLEPRRIEARAMIIDAPILIDPADDPLRYNQAIEITPVDR